MCIFYSILVWEIVKVYGGLLNFTVIFYRVNYEGPLADWLSVSLL